MNHWLPAYNGWLARAAQSGLYILPASCTVPDVVYIRCGFSCLQLLQIWLFTAVAALAVYIRLLRL